MSIKKHSTVTTNRATEWSRTAEITIEPLTHQCVNVVHWKCIENTLFVAHRTSSSQAVINVSLCALFAIACLLLLIYGQNRIDAIKHMNQPFLFIGRLLMMLPPLLLWLQLAHWVFQYNFFLFVIVETYEKMLRHLPSLSLSLLPKRQHCKVAHFFVFGSYVRETVL